MASELGLEEGIEGVSMGRQVEERRTVAQVCICSGLCSDSRALCWVEALVTRVEARRTIGQVLFFEVIFDTRAFQNGNPEEWKSRRVQERRTYQLRRRNPRQHCPCMSMEKTEGAKS